MANSTFNIGGIPVDFETTRRHQALIENPAYRNRNAIGHDLAVAEVTAFYEQLVGNGSQGAAGMAAGPGARNSGEYAALTQRLAEIHADPAYADAKASRHRPLVEEAMTVVERIAAIEDGGTGTN